MLIRHGKYSWCNHCFSFLFYHTLFGVLLKWKWKRHAVFLFRKICKMHMDVSIHRSLLKIQVIFLNSPRTQESESYDNSSCEQILFSWWVILDSFISKTHVNKYYFILWSWKEMFMIFSIESRYQYRRRISIDRDQKYVLICRHIFISLSLFVLNLSRVSDHNTRSWSSRTSCFYFKIRFLVCILTYQCSIFIITYLRIKSSDDLFHVVPDALWSHLLLVFVIISCVLSVGVYELSASVPFWSHG